ncbi:MAG TPA: BadF/BadG/BcrA/BcrD ATPase family protein [Terriglobales bacterium]|nr:BadF/BadG/BcrA/BcrD ATPase family protein [Terriglobales bacterium]
MAFFLGIDGGGSKTSCAIGDETSILGTGTSAGSNLVRLSAAQVREALAAAIRQACTVAKVVPSEIQRTCVGLAGAAQPEITELALRLVSELVPGKIEVVGDMVIALEAGFGAGPGVIVIAGTGSIAYGRNRQGETARAGGWGFAISDEGSGHWIGRGAVAAAMRAGDEDEDLDQGPNPPLLESVLKSWGLKTRDQLVLAANATPPPDFSGLFPGVLSLADSGDRTAREVLSRAGVELANLATIVMERLFPQGAEARVAMSGGVFSKSSLVRQVFYNSLRSKRPGVSINPTVVQPVRGALELARKGAAKW